MLLIFLATIFFSSALLFLLEPMIGKMLLPLFGGTPLIWSTCIMFFQMVLLAGYFYVHYLSQRMSLRLHVLVHSVIALLPVWILPVAIHYNPLTAGKMHPIVYVLFILVTGIGLPFFVLSTTGPLLQKWYSKLDTKHAKMPYFMYSVSNVGSLLPLIIYPTILEPNLPLSMQNNAWAYGYYLFLALLSVIGGVLLWKAKIIREIPEMTEQKESESEAVKPGLHQKISWMLLAFVPSSLMLGITLFITDELAIAPGPFFWVIPMSLYFVSFILVFSQKPLFTTALTAKILCFTMIFTAASFFIKPQEFLLFSLVAHLINYFLLCVFFHGMLWKSKPDARYLTDFYLFLAIGGALGGIFNTLLAPWLFPNILEYPLMLFLAIFFFPWAKSGTVEKKEKSKWMMREAIISMLVLCILLWLSIWVVNQVDKVIFLLAFCILASYLMIQNPFRLIVIFSLVFIAYVGNIFESNILFQKRDFFGVHKVRMDPKNNEVVFSHGNTIHGIQSVSLEKKLLPTTYYHQKGPLGDFFKKMASESPSWKVGAAGMGIGTMLCYKQAGQQWTYYEISPTVIQIANDAKYFSLTQTFQPKILEGDARLLIEREKDESFDVILLDAYSSDNIPAHLLTKEAFEMYRAKLKKGGFIVSNISNRVLDLTPVFAALSENLGFYAVVKKDLNITDEDRKEGKLPSIWTIVSERETLYQDFHPSEGWSILKNDKSFRMWTDDYTSIFSIMNLKKD